MRNGAKRCLITIELPTKVKQANSSVVTTWSTFKQLWASIETLKGGEKVSACAAWPKADQKISFRFIDGVLPTMRIVFSGYIYSILGINNVDMRNRELILTTESGVKAQ